MPYDEMASLNISIGRDTQGLEFRAVLNEAERLAGDGWNASEFVRRVILGAWNRTEDRVAKAVAVSMRINGESKSAIELARERMAS